MDRKCDFETVNVSNDISNVSLTLSLYRASIFLNIMVFSTRYLISVSYKKTFTRFCVQSDSMQNANMIDRGRLHKASIVSLNACKG